jgi:hypothetical protein
MRVCFALFLLTISLVIIGCARRNQATYVELPPDAPPHVSNVKLASVSATRPANSEARRSADDSPRKPPKEQSEARVVNKSQEETGRSFADIKAKAQQVGVEHLSQSDIQGLSYDQIQELRGY